MKRIFCLRHAQALSADGRGDQERRLSAQGQADARALGLVMVARGYKPDLVLCSSAVRTRMTWEGLSGDLSDCVVRFEDVLYHGSLGDYMALLKSVDEIYEHVLIIGHNPIIHALAANLASENGSPHLSDVMSRYMPCTLSVFDCSAPDWVSVVPHQNSLTDLVVPDGL